MGDVSGVASADTVGETIRDAMHIFTGEPRGKSEDDSIVDEERGGERARDGVGAVGATESVRRS